MTFSGMHFTLIGPPDTATERKIKSYATLQPGWNYGEGCAFDQKVVATALAVYRNLLSIGLTATDAFPGMGGQIMVTAYSKKADNYYIEYTIEVDGLVSIIVRKNNTKIVSRFHVDEIEAIKELVKVRGEIWTTSGLSTQNTVLTGAAESSIGTRSELETTAAFPLSNASA